MRARHRHTHRLRHSQPPLLTAAARRRCLLRLPTAHSPSARLSDLAGIEKCIDTLCCTARCLVSSAANERIAMLESERKGATESNAELKKKLEGEMANQEDIFEYLRGECVCTQPCS